MMEHEERKQDHNVEFYYLHPKQNKRRSYDDVVYVQLKTLRPRQ